MAGYKGFKSAGIYELRCGPFYYIGATNEVYSRFKQHLALLNRGSHNNQLLQTAYNCYKKLSLNIIEQCYVKDKKRLEIARIKQYKQLYGKYLTNIRIK